MERGDWKSAADGGTDYALQLTGASDILEKVGLGNFIKSEETGRYVAGLAVMGAATLATGGGALAFIGAGAALGTGLGYGVEVYNNYQQGNANPWTNVNGWNVADMAFRGGVSGSIAAVMAPMLPAGGASWSGVGKIALGEFLGGRAMHIIDNVVNFRPWNDELGNPYFIFSDIFLGTASPFVVRGMGNAVKRFRGASRYAGDAVDATVAAGKKVDDAAGAVGKNVGDAADAATTTRLKNLDSFTDGNRTTKTGNELRQALTSNSNRGSLSKRTKAAQAWAETGADTNNPAIRGAINKRSQLKQSRTRLGIPEKGKPNTLITKIRDWAYGYGLDPENYASWTLKAGKGGKVVGRDGEVLSNGWYMYVVDKDNNVRYLPTESTPTSNKPFNQYRAHTQLAGGENVWGAGTFQIEDGKFKIVDTGSGHYKPTQAHLDYTEELLKKQGFHTKSAKFEAFKPIHPAWHPKEIYRLSKDVAGTIHVGTQRLLGREAGQLHLNRKLKANFAEDYKAIEVAYKIIEKYRIFVEPCTVYETMQLSIIPQMC
ncbi:MAG: hypothetical protein GY927_14265 [bacterium]|nr:hypothetical protein [bacterium]